MMCQSLNPKARSKLPDSYHLRNCRKDELAFWKTMPFDTEREAKDMKTILR